MENYGNTTSKNGSLQTKYSVLNQIVNFLSIKNIVDYGAVLVELARRMYKGEVSVWGNPYPPNLCVTSTGYLCDYVSANYNIPQYQSLVRYLQTGDDPNSDLYRPYPAFYPYSRHELVQLRLDSNDNICFMRGTDYYTLASTGLEVKHLDTLFT